MRKFSYLLIVICLITSCSEQKEQKTHKENQEKKTVSLDSIEIQTQETLEEVVKDEIEFELIIPDVTSLQATYVANEYKKELLYLYVTTYYDSVSSKENIQRHDFGDNNICAYEQEFELGLKYTLVGCRESGGATVKIEFPKIELEILREWINKIHASNSGDLDNKWSDDNMSFSPDGAGCDYHIKEDVEKIIVSTYCGC